MISASKAELLKLCQYWARPDVAAHLSNATTREATQGTEVHAVIRACVARAPEKEWPGLSTLDGLRMWGQAHAWLKARSMTFMRAEVPLAWDPTTDTGVDLSDIVAELGLSGARPYSAPENWGRIRSAAGLSEAAIPMTVDLIDIDHGAIVLYDWTTSWSAHAATDKTAQLSLNAVSVARAMKCDNVKIVRLAITTTELVETELATFDEFGLSAVAGEVMALLALVPEAQPQPGMHCTELYCPAKGACPATSETLAQIVPPAQLARFKFTHEIESVEHAAAILPMYKLASSYVDMVGDGLREWAKSHGPIPTSHGKEWGPGVRNMPRFDSALALALLKQLGATEEQIAALTKVKQEPTFSERKVRVA